MILPWRIIDQREERIERIDGLAIENSCSTEREEMKIDGLVLKQERQFDSNALRQI